jgi:septation ring formation regulator EzrA
MEPDEILRNLRKLHEMSQYIFYNDFDYDKKAEKLEKLIEHVEEGKTKKYLKEDEDDDD